MRFTIQSLKGNAEHRKPGYVEHVLDVATRQGDWLELTTEQFQTIRKQFALDHIFPVSIPRDQWPLWAKAFLICIAPEDTGIGDTVARLIGDENSEAFKKWFRATFNRECGCNGRQRLWNRLYPLNQ